MVEAAISSAVRKLDSFWAHEEYLTSFSKYTNVEVEGLKNDLILMLDFLRNSGLSQKNFKEGGSRLKYLISDVEDLAHDAQLLRSHAEIVSLRGGLHETKERILHYVFEGAWVSLIRSHINVVEGDEDEDEGDVVGLEEDVELMLRNDNYHTTCIVGMSGIGKTTLARKLYNHVAIVSRFDCRAWVCLSSELSRKEVLMKLIRQVVDANKLKRDVLLEKMESMDNRSLRLMLRQHLWGMRYFIVLDDMEKQKFYYKPALEALPRGGVGSRLLLTSRTEITTSFLGDCSYIHEMKFLDHNKSWNLFLKTLFSGNSTSYHKLPKQLEKKGREMLVKCYGLPLAIKEVGRQWAEKRQSGSEWEEVLESTDLGATLSSLELSYHKWSPKVKSCFLHLSFFKEGTTIRAEKLKQVLIAGLVVSQKEIYETYLYNLISEYIVEVKDRTKDSKIKNCRINPIFHSLSITIAEKETIFEILSNNGKNQPSQEPCHRAIYCSREKFNYSTDHDEHIVSLFFRGGGGGNFDASPSYWKHFQLLKILDLEGFGLKILPETVGTLTKLRYLGLRNNCIQELPRSLGCLKNLEVLDIALNFTVEVPDITFAMDSLCHVYMSDIICQKPLKIDALKNLKTLTYISVDNWTYELSGIRMMTKLRKLGIEELDGNSDVSKLFSSLAELRYLDCLILRGFRFRSMPSLDKLGVLHSVTQLKLDGLLPRLPSANNFPPNICFLTLVNTSLDEDPMPILEKLSKLYYLKLRNAYNGGEVVISDYGFPSLGVLCLGELCHLRNVQVSKHGMQSLLELEIDSCLYLENVPEVMIDNLEKLKITTTKRIATKIRESGLISKIRHVDIQP